MSFIKKLINLFYLFFKISLITFGGGYACLPIMERELVEKRKIITNQELLANYAVAQMMPGLITVNIGVLIGYKENKFFGALAITLGTVMPPLIIGLLISIMLNRYMNIAIVDNVFWGIRAGVCVLIFNVISKLVKQMEKKKVNFFIIFVSFLLYHLFNLSPICIIVMAVMFFVLLEWKAKNDKNHS